MAVRHAVRCSLETMNHIPTQCVDCCPENCLVFGSPMSVYWARKQITQCTNCQVCGQTLSFARTCSHPRYLQPVHARWTVHRSARNARICYKIIGSSLHTCVEITKKSVHAWHNVIKQRQTNDRLEVHIIKMISHHEMLDKSVCNFKL